MRWSSACTDGDPTAWTSPERVGVMVARHGPDHVDRRGDGFLHRLSAARLTPTLAIGAASALIAAGVDATRPDAGGRDALRRWLEHADPSMDPDGTVVGILAAVTSGLDQRPGPDGLWPTTNLLGPLHAAARSGVAAWCAALIAAGADPDAPDGAGHVPAVVAIIGGHGAAAEAILRCGADPFTSVDVGILAGVLPERFAATAADPGAGFRVRACCAALGVSSVPPGVPDDDDRAWAGRLAAVHGAPWDLRLLAAAAA